MNAPKTFFVACTLFASCALLAACSVLPAREAVQIWQPEESTIAAPTTAADFSLRVDAPNTSGPLDGTGIVVMPEPGQVSTYKGARWSESPALLIRHRLVDAFMAAKLPAVTTDDDHFASDYSLSGNLRGFQSEYRNGSPVVVVRFDAQLRRGGARNLLATRSFVVTQNPSGVDVPQIVGAFGAADDQLAQQVVAWTIDVANRDKATHPAGGDDAVSQRQR
ncbi:MAG TPA: ABC-type transport auxiliary lipoprotein family protein [Rhodanobacteraceae bacterium]|jgi:cholesterol transport system auxiliary component|nr:ABC-type transport auxiliary lipoprotein family protein [Rhodanobacteraceae bacterium]